MRYRNKVKFYLEINTYIRVYAGYFFIYMSYKMIFYTLSEIFNQVDEIIDNNDEIKDISTTHKYSVGKEIRNIISGGQGIVIRSEGVMILGKKVVLLSKLLAERFLITPLSKAIGFIVMKFPLAKKVYNGIKAIKIVIASILALLSVRLIARFDYWALIVNGSLPQLPIETKTILSGIRRLRMGQKELYICIPKSNEILNLVIDEDISVKRKEKELIDLFAYYQMLPEHHDFKNKFFTCIIYLLMALFVGDKIGFKLALRLLYRLLNEGKISLETYCEILSQLVIGGISVIDVEIV